MTKQRGGRRKSAHFVFSSLSRTLFLTNTVGSPVARRRVGALPLHRTAHRLFTLLPNASFFHTLGRTFTPHPPLYSPYTLKHAWTDRVASPHDLYTHVL